MRESMIAEFLDWLGARAERLSWWAYDRRSRIRLARLHRYAATAAGTYRTPSTYMPPLRTVPQAKPVAVVEPVIALAPIAVPEPAVIAPPFIDHRKRATA